MVCGALGPVACSSSDDNVGNTGDSGAPDGSTPDATTVQDAASPDTGTDAKPDTGSIPDADADAAACTGFDASALDDASVGAGFEQVWKVYRCQGCHQKGSQPVNDAGQGIVLSGNNDGLGDSGTIFPPNLTGDPGTGLGCWTDSQIQDAFLNGVDDEGRTLCAPMPKFGTAVKGADGGVRAGYPMDAGTAKEIVDFLRSLPVAVNEVQETTCPAPQGDASTDAAADAAADAGADAGSQDQ